MWRNEDLIEVLADGAYPLAGATPPDTTAEGRADREGDRRRRRATACTCPRRR